MDGKQEADADAEDALLADVVEALLHEERGSGAEEVARTIRRHANYPVADTEFGHFWDFAPRITWATFVRYRRREWYDVNTRRPYTLVYDDYKGNEDFAVVQRLVFAEALGPPPGGRQGPGAPQRLGEYLIMQIGTWYGMPAAVMSNSKGVVTRMVVPRELARDFMFRKLIHRHMIRDLISVMPAYRGLRVVRHVEYTGKDDPEKMNRITMELEDRSDADVIVRFYNLKGSPLLELDPVIVDREWNSEGMDGLSEIAQENVRIVFQGYLDLVFKTSAFNARPVARFLREYDPEMLPHVAAMRTIRADPDATRLS